MSESAISDTQVTQVALTDRNTQGNQRGVLAESAAWACLALAVASSLLLPDFGYGKIPAVAKGFSVLQIGLALFAFLFAAIYAAAKGGSHRTQRQAILWLILAMVVAWHGMATTWSIGRSNVKYSIAGFWQSTSLWLLLPTVAWLAQSPREAARVLKLVWIIVVFALVSGFWRQGLLGERFESGGILVAAWPLLLGWFVQTLNRIQDGSFGTNATSSRRAGWGWVIPLILMLGTGIGLLLNKNVTAWLAAAIATVLAFLLDPLLRTQVLRSCKQQPLGACAFAFACLCVFGAIYIMDPRFLLGIDDYLANRTEAWKSAWGIVNTQPWMGHGSLNFDSTYLQLETFMGANPPSNPRSFLLEISHSGGWPLLGLTLFLVFVVALRGGCFRSSPASEMSASEESSSHRGDKRELAAKLFWIASILSVLLFIAYVLFYKAAAKDGQAIALIGAVLFGFWLVRNQASTTSAQMLVRTHSILFLVGFLGAMIYFAANEGWMVPEEMIVPILAFSLWIAASHSEQVAEGDPPQRGAPAKGQRRWLGAAIASILLGLWGWSMAEPLARSTQVWFSMTSAAKDGNNEPMPPEAYAKAINSVRFDPDLPEIGMGYCVNMLGRELSENAKERWLHQFQQTRTWLIERDPSNAMAYASAGKHSILACMSMMGEAASSQDMVSPGGGGARRGQSGRGRRGPALSPIASRMLQESLGYYREASNKAPGNIEIQWQAAIAAAMAGNWKVCETMFDKAEKITNDNMNAKRPSREVVLWIPAKMIPVIESQAKRGSKLTDEANESWNALAQHVSQNERVPTDLLRGALSSMLKKKD